MEGVRSRDFTVLRKPLLPFQNYHLSFSLIRSIALLSVKQDGRKRKSLTSLSLSFLSITRKLRKGWVNRAGFVLQYSPEKTTVVER